jgi:hypothetical protein
VLQEQAQPHAHRSSGDLASSASPHLLPPPQNPILSSPAVLDPRAACLPHLVLLLILVLLVLLLLVIHQLLQQGVSSVEPLQLPLEPLTPLRTRGMCTGWEGGKYRGRLEWKGDGEEDCAEGPQLWDPSCGTPVVGPQCCGTPVVGPQFHCGPESDFPFRTPGNRSGEGVKGVKGLFRDAIAAGLTSAASRLPLLAPEASSSQGSGRSHSKSESSSSAAALRMAARRSFLAAVSSSCCVGGGGAGSPFLLLCSGCGGGGACGGMGVYVCTQEGGRACGRGWSRRRGVHAGSRCMHACCMGFTHGLAVPCLAHKAPCNSLDGGSPALHWLCWCDVRHGAVLQQILEGVGVIEQSAQKRQPLIFLLWVHAASCCCRNHSSPCSIRGNQNSEELSPNDLHLRLKPRKLRRQRGGISSTAINEV